MDYAIVNLRDRRDLILQGSAWFHAKWGVPLEAYRESMEACVQQQGAVPQWYLALAGGGIIGGLGVIENDFHDRRDLSPNVCAVYVEAEHRCQGIAGALLDHVCADMARLGVDTLYLLTDHISFYERYNWTFLCNVQGDGEEKPSRMYVRRWGGS